MAKIQYLRKILIVWMLISAKWFLIPAMRSFIFFPQDYIVDYERGIKDPVGMQESGWKGIFISLPVMPLPLKTSKNVWSWPILKVSGLVLEPVASCESVLNEEEKEAGVCLIDIGGGTTDIAIFSDGLLRHTGSCSPRRRNHYKRYKGGLQCHV